MILARRPTSRQLAQTSARACDEKKAQNVVILDVRKLTSICDFFVIATTQSDRQSRAIAMDMERSFKQKGIRIRGSEGLRSGGWALLDIGDAVLHLFHGDRREFYDLDSLWGDAPRIAWCPARKRRKAN